MVKNPPRNTGDAGSIPESERSPGGGNGNPLQYSSMELSLQEYWSGLPVPSPGGSNDLHEVPMQTLESSLNLTLGASFFDTVA